MGKSTTIGLGFLIIAAGAIVGVRSWQAAGSPTERPTVERRKMQARTAEPQMVKVRVFDRQGELVGPVEVPKLVLSDAEWRERLTRDQFKIMRSKGTERPFCGTLLDNKLEGVYTCAGCSLPLFASDSKFNSGTGWPSFFQPIAEENVGQHQDFSHGMFRTEITCARCDGHLGHVFPDGPRPTGLRFCLNSESLEFTESDQLATLADPAAEHADRQAARKPAATATAVLAGGCFWCTEAVFLELKGVSQVTSGYAGGTAETANYEDVCSGKTGHAEVIRVVYDPEQISFEQLLEVFFDAHDPTQLNRQGNDVGPQYRSAIFYASEEERSAAEAKMRELTEAKKFRKPIVTTLEELTEFYPAEAYHQNYARNNPNQPYIVYQSTPKVCKIREKHTDLVKPEE